MPDGEHTLITVDEPTGVAAWALRRGGRDRQAQQEGQAEQAQEGGDKWLQGHGNHAESG
jgi:hypothetical protein